MTGEVKPQDERSGLLERTWVRRTDRTGDLTERSLEGEQVQARFLGEQGRLHDVAGEVARTPEGTLVVEGWTNGARRQTFVPRDAHVDMIGRTGRARR
jgi:hypothetical protein